MLPWKFCCWDIWATGLCDFLIDVGVGLMVRGILLRFNGVDELPLGRCLGITLVPSTVVTTGALFVTFI